MKFNVHKWDGKSWVYVATATAANEQVAARMVAQRFNISGRFAAYPHINNPTSQATSNTIYTMVG